MQDEYLTMVEAQELLKCSYRPLRRRIDDGRLPAKKELIPGSAVPAWRIKRSDLDAMQLGKYGLRGAK